MSDATSSPNGSNGRFVKGNAGGPGNPYARSVARLRGLLLEAVTDDDLKAIVAAMVTKAKAGNLDAAREVLTRMIGRPTLAPDPDRMDCDERIVEAYTLEAEKRLKRANSPS